MITYKAPGTCPKQGHEQLEILLLHDLMHDASMIISTRTLETMPLVMLSESPPSGYPATKIES